MCILPLPNCPAIVGRGRMGDVTWVRGTLSISCPGTTYSQKMTSQGLHTQFSEEERGGKTEGWKEGGREKENQQ